MEKSIVYVIAIFIVLLKYGHPQECRQVTVCDRDISREEKGDAGSPGKAGPPGSRGEKGNRGSNCETGDMGQQILDKLEELQQAAIPTSCETSLRYGRQTLRSGGDVFCDGKWTVFQKRFNGSVDFNRDWNDYKNGFGSLDGEFWFGLEKLHLFTKQRGCRVRFDIWSFDGDHAFAEYSEFYIEDESDNYRLHIAGYSGTAGDSITGSQSIDTRQFSTRDRDNDASSEGGLNCAAESGGWWHRLCSHVFLNNDWGVSEGVWTNNVWFDWKGHSEALKETVMKSRCD